MRLWADVYSIAGVKLGEGPIRSIPQASITRLLDGAGSIGFAVPLNDERAVRLLLNEVRVKLYAELDGETLLVGDGLVRRRQIDVASGGLMLRLDGPDLLDTLKRSNTLLARIYTSQSVESIATSLTALAGWTASTTGGASDLTARFDGASVLKALQELVEHQGLHLRLGDADSEIEVGAFGDASGVRIVNPARLSPETAFTDEIALIEDLTVQQNSEAVCNWLVPLGQGEGEAALTLEHSTRTSPYTIQTLVVNSKTHYYLSDDASITAYGQIEKVGVFRAIGAVSNSDADLENAANALYDAASAWLLRNALRLDTYSCTVRKLKTVLRPGDQVRLVYAGTVTTPEGVAHMPVEIDDDFWVMKVSERFGLEGRAVDLTLASVDRVERDAAQLIIGALDDIQLANTRIQTYPNIRSIVYWRTMDSTHTATVPVQMTNRTTLLNQAKVFFITRPFRATVSGSAAGGGTTVASAGGGTLNSQTGDYLGDPGGSHTHPFSISSHTHNVTLSDHTHDLDYGIHDDSEYPDTISLYIDGVDRTSALGGPWDVGGAGADEELDITTYLVNAAGGLRSKHEVEFQCDGGQGEVEVTIELYETVQSIAP